MSGVVFRCPHCGTVKAGPGECEACSEAQVRYFCSNHTPGRWLDTPACPQCGARFGNPEPARAASKPAARPAPPEREPTRAPPSRPRPSPAAAPKPARSPWGRLRSPPPSDPLGGPTPPRSPRTMTLPELLAAARRGRAPAGYGAPAPIRPARSPIASAIRRIVFLGLFVVIAMVVFGALSGGPLLEILLNILLNSGGF